MRLLTKSLMARIVSYFLLLSLVTVSLVAYVAFLQARDALTQSVFERLRAVATLKEDTLSQWVGDQSQSVLFIAHVPEVRAMASVLSSHDPSEPDYQSAYIYLSEYLGSLIASQPDLQEIFLLADADGKVVFSTDPIRNGEDKSSDLYFIEGRWRTFVQNVYHSAQDKPTMTISTPLLDDTGQRLGVLAAHLNLERMDAIILERASLGESGETYLVDKFNVFVSRERFGREDFPAGVHSQGIDAALQTSSGFGLYSNYQGVPVIGVYRWLANRDLALLAEMHQEEAFVPARQLGLNIFAIGLGSAGLLAVGVYLLARRLTSPVFDLVTGAKRAAQGILDQPVPVRSRDELGTLAETFNVMQAGLHESRLKLEEYARTLEHRVADRTAELQQANVVLLRRALQLETSSQVGQQVTSILDQDELLAQMVHLIQQSFGYYFVGVWLVTEKQDAVMLRAGIRRDGERLDIQDSIIPMETSSIVVGVCKTKTYRLVDDVSEASDYLSTEGLPDTRSELALPLRIGETILGVLDIENDVQVAFVSDDVMVLQTLADQIAIAIRNAQLYEKEQRRRWLAESLARAGRELSSSLDLREVPGRILEQLLAVVPYERGAVMLRDDDVLRIVAQQGSQTDKDEQVLPIPIREGDAFEQVIANCQPMLLDDIQVTGWQVEWLATNKSWLGVPLVSKDRVIGVMSLARQDSGAFTPDDATLVSAFAGQAAIALENASLYDEITQFNEQLEQVVLQRTEELKKAYQTLERLDKTKSDFINIAAHELRTPLTLIKGYAQLLETIAEDNPDAVSFLNGILSGQKRLQEIINSMLDVSKIDSHVLSMHKEPASLAHIISRVQSEFEEALRKRRLTLTVADLEDLPVLEADPDLLHKVFYHLIVNAIKYTPDGGLIEVNGRVITYDEIGSMIEIVVSDTGIGIDPENHELIFEKFYQTGEVTVHSSGRTKFKGGGPGLGLPIARGIVHAHGGRIWVESEGYDEKRCPGSRFYVCLPIAPQ